MSTEEAAGILESLLKIIAEPPGASGDVLVRLYEAFPGREEAVAKAIDEFIKRWGTAPGQFPALKKCVRFPRGTHAGLSLCPPPGSKNDRVAVLINKLYCSALHGILDAAERAPATHLPRVAISSALQREVIAYFKLHAINLKVDPVRLSNLLASSLRLRCVTFLLI